MKLLKKSTIDAEINARKRAQIDEGVELAQKIDTLRNTLNDLEVQHRNFIDGMQGELTKATDTLFEEIAEGKNEIKELIVQKGRLLATFPRNYEELLEEKDRLAVIRLKLDKDKEKLIEIMKLERVKLRNIKVRERELANIISNSKKDETSNITNKPS